MPVRIAIHLSQLRACTIAKLFFQAYCCLVCACARSRERARAREQAHPRKDDRKIKRSATQLTVSPRATASSRSPRTLRPTNVRPLCTLEQNQYSDLEATIGCRKVGGASPEGCRFPLNILVCARAGARPRECARARASKRVDTRARAHTTSCTRASAHKRLRWPALTRGIKRSLAGPQGVVSQARRATELHFCLGSSPPTVDVGYA